MIDLFLECVTLLEDGEDVAMVTIINREGSAPRSAGSKMLVHRDGSIAGTIGGGLFEAQAILLAQEAFKSGEAMTRSFRFSGNDASGMDMICGGGAEIFIDLLRSDHPESVELCRAVGDEKCCGRDAFLVTKIATGPGSTDRIKMAIITGDQRIVGMPLSEDDQAALTRMRRGRFPQVVKLGEASYQIEPIHSPATVYIFGAGHVSQKVAHLTAFVDFKTVVVDDREEYANKKRFPLANHIIVPDNMEQCISGLDISINSYIVIVTRGHVHDMVILAQAIRTGAGYIGMIGSKRKRETIYRHLRQSGIQEEMLARVHCPIGIDIEAETPEEIAISIVGELILARAKLING